MDVYYEIENAIRNHETQMVVPFGLTQDDVYLSIRRIMRENPDIFWFSHQWRYTENEKLIRFQYTISKDKTIKAKAQIDDVVQNDFRIDEVRRLSVNEQIMYVYKWIALYCKYNIFSAYNQTIYSVFVCRNSVCTGYAKAAQYLFKMLGIESKLVFGTMHNSEKGSRHCWLIVNVNSHWYHFDPTFAVPEINDLLYKAGVKPIFGTEGLVYNYFCCDTDTVKLSRIIEDESELPKCDSAIDYKSLQNLSIRIHRGNETGFQGVKGCLLSDVGNSALIYLWHSDDNNQKVVKIYKNDSSHKLIEHERRVMQALVSCPSVIHICRVTDRMDGIIMEQATPLSDLLCSHYYQLSAVNFCKLLLDVLAGLQGCMEHGVYYRDIHLNNIYRTSKGRYALGDFGSCVWIDQEDTTNFGGVGSPWYVAPETSNNGVFDETSSVYGVGMLAYFLLNDLFPPLWKEYREESLRLRVSGHELPFPTLLKHPSCAFEQQLLFVIIKSLSFEPNRRYQTLSDLVKAIEQCMCLVENDDYLLVDGGSSERLMEFDKRECVDKNFNTHTSFHSTCIEFSDVLVSNGEMDSGDAIAVDDQLVDDKFPKPSPPPPISRSYFDNKQERINDFATTSERRDFHNEEILKKKREELRRRLMEGETIVISSYGSTETDDAPTIHIPHGKLAGGILSSFEPTTDNNKLYHKKTSIWSRLFKAYQYDVVHSSIFAPSEVKPKSHMLVQVYLHLFEETNKVVILARESHEEAVRRDYIPLQCKLKKGDKVDVQLSVYGEFLLMSDRKSVVWQGSFTKCSFDYFVPKDIDIDEISCITVLTVNDALVGEMRFITRIVEQPRKLNSEVFAHQYKKIFISYAHQDESKVEPMARAYKAQGVDYFFDRHYLKPGDIFPLKIKEFIDTADLFILCWSANAAKSGYVELERKHALERAFPKIKPLEKAKLTIYPMSIEPRAELPADMKDTYNFEVI